MGWQAYVALGTTIVVFLLLQLRRRVPTDLLFLGGLVAVTLCGVITPREALQGFSNNAIITIGGLMVCAAGLRRTGLIDWIGERLLGSVTEERPALVRLAVSLVASSAFLLNTALVVMTMPFVLDWCRKRSVSPSRLLIPISYLTILGGVLTLVGTSTTLVVNGELQREHNQRLAEVDTLAARANQAGINVDADLLTQKVAFANQVRPMKLFELGWVGLPCALIGGVVLIALAPVLLPDRREIVDQFDALRRDYLVEMKVLSHCNLIGKSVAAAGLRNLPGLFLIEIDRGYDVITPVSPNDIIYDRDRLVFSGVVETIVDLEKIPGLVPDADEDYETEPAARGQRHLVEVVMSRSCPLVGTTVRASSFRQRYGAAVVAVHRNGVRVTNKIGNIVLEPGDTLLLQARGDFVSKHRNSRDFYLVSDVQESTPRRHERAVWAALLAVALIFWLSMTNFFREQEMLAGASSTAIAAIAIAGLMIFMRCLSMGEARSAIDLPLLLTIAGALGIAKALYVSGAAAFISDQIIGLLGDNPWLLLIAIYFLTAVFTELITNNAVAVAMFPIAVEVAERANYSPRPFIMAIALAASLSFVTPIGYQTNLMVMGPGGYRPSDYLRLGLPIAITVAIVALALIPHLWPFVL
jgi:di/tricarboxylate transporter